MLKLFFTVEPSKTIPPALAKPEPLEVLYITEALTSPELEQYETGVLVLSGTIPAEYEN